MKKIEWTVNVKTNFEICYNVVNKVYPATNIHVSLHPSLRFGCNKSCYETVNVVEKSKQTKE